MYDRLPVAFAAAPAAEWSPLDGPAAVSSRPGFAPGVVEFSVAGGLRSARERALALAVADAGLVVIAGSESSAAAWSFVSAAVPPAPAPRARDARGRFVAAA